ncbi:MAG: sigma 54-interacting transcriptional regulator [Myxococcaceae bacterium]|nr:sigma 54-interacting transcriptional regulator [Myxococcaceae bacterium]
MVLEKTDRLTPSGPPPTETKLVVVAGNDFGKEFRLEAGTYRLGKDPSVEFVLSDSSVSRIHLLIEVRRDGVVLTDNESTNGSFCNGTRFSRISPAVGAVVRVGKSSLRLLPANVRAQALAPADATAFGPLLGRSLPMRELFTTLERAAKSEASIFIGGETGTGKEVCARAIHLGSPRTQGPFVVADLGAAPRELIESELFGHKKGSFTGATADRVGVIERANGGTLFLDEVAELPVDLQSRLLRALEQREVKPLGANAYVPVDLRVISATHKNLQAEMAAGRFRADLFHRLCAVEVQLPPLRSRPDDIWLLTDAFLEQLGQPASAISAATRQLFAAYDWPGNARELRNLVERVVSLGDAATLPDLVPRTAPDAPGSAGVSRTPYHQAKDTLLNAFEKDYLVDLLHRCQGNVSEASREAGVDRAHLHRLMKKHDLDKWSYAATRKG